MKKLARVIAVSMAVATLFGCGGGDGGGNGAAPQQALVVEAAAVPVTIPVCPEKYRSINLENSSISNATMSLTVGNAAFIFKTPAGKIPSMRICFGLAPVAAVDGGMYMLSETYDLKVYPETGLTNPASGIIEPRIVVDFDLTKVPAGTTPTDRESRTRLFNDAAGPLAVTPHVSIALDDFKKIGTITAKPIASGKYVVAYKP